MLQFLKDSTDYKAERCKQVSLDKVYETFNVLPAGTHSLPPQLLEMKEKVKRIVDDCLAKSGIASPMEDILQSGDIDQLRPVCRHGS